ncbi:ABC transporter substrate-binding protein [Hufsiella ginkgonis]|uniref:Substrate-binding domain-containing protein n=1 Tax=Hufsiella ginkgonis TaxID=2695274 RepID=A0A7K1Y016_9SPHI|nr:ABC transporter substrate-binding protein [Hufsiella ginkgonis]MXV16611.1 substrate-binding domain-containing protein [Hufsiella ginkgonis]
MSIRKNAVLLLTILFLFACGSAKKDGVPSIGFMDAFEDATIAQARAGFTDALKKNGFSEDAGTVKIIYRNAQGDIPTLTQIASYFVSEKVDLIATCPTLSTITAVQKTRGIPVCMIVSPTPQLMKLTDASGSAPDNLFGTAEELAYIDTSFSLIPKLVKPKGAGMVVGMVYNQSEPQSVDALNRIKAVAAGLNVTVEALPLNNSAEAQLITKRLLSGKIDAFFANPDNTVFSAFDTIFKNCDEAGVPVFTSEAGLVQRGAVAAFGADLYQWGYQSGEQAAKYLKTRKIDGLAIEMVKVRKRVFNAVSAKKFGITVPDGFEEVKR